MNTITHKLNSKKFIRFIKWLVLICSYSYITYLLINYDKYPELASQLLNTSFQQLLWLLLAISLIPINLLLESSKWKYIVSKSQILSIKDAFKSVLVGFSTGFITPNRTGDMLGRMAYLSPENRKQAVVYSLLNSYTLTLVLACCGLPTGIILYLKVKNIALFTTDIKLYFGIIVFGIMLSLLAYFSLPQLHKLIKNKTINSFSRDLKQFTKSNLVQILIFSLIRYAVFCFQFYAILQFFSIDLEVWQALLAIPANYLFVTFTPSMAFSEPAIRSSYAMIFIGMFSDQLINIALAGTLIWVLNFSLPMLAGSYILAKK